MARLASWVALVALALCAAGAPPGERSAAASAAGACIDAFEAGGFAALTGLLPSEAESCVEKGVYLLAAGGLGDRPWPEQATLEDVLEERGRNSAFEWFAVCAPPAPACGWDQHLALAWHYLARHKWRLPEPLFAAAPPDGARILARIDNWAAGASALRGEAPLSTAEAGAPRAAPLTGGALDRRPSELRCIPGAQWKARLVGGAQGDDCMAELLEQAATMRFINYLPASVLGEGFAECHLMAHGGEVELERGYPDGIQACEYYPLRFSDGVTVGRDISCAGSCGSEHLGNFCCERPGLRSCALSLHRELARCVGESPPHSAATSRGFPDDYTQQRSYHVASCLPRVLEDVDVVIELFTGSAEYLRRLSGLASRARVFSVEGDQALAEEAQALLGGVVLRLEGGGGRGPPRLRAPGGEFREASEVFKTLGNGLYFINGFTFPPREGGSGGAEYGGGQEQPNVLRALCESIPAGSRVLALIDPDVGIHISLEWAILAEACPLAYVGIWNTNLPQGAGYIRDHLLSSSDAWAEAFRWQERILSDQGAWLAPNDREFMPRRSASLLVNSRACRGV